MKRGVSPLVATVILVGIVIVISLFLWFWYGRFIEERVSKTETFLSQKCAQETEIMIRNGSCKFKPSTYLITMDISNTGSSKITKLSFNVNTQKNSANREADKLLDAGTALEYTITISQSELSNEIPAEVKIIPGISKDQTLR